MLFVKLSQAMLQSFFDRHWNIASLVFPLLLLCRSISFLVNTGSFSRDLLHEMSGGVLASVLQWTGVESETQLILTGPQPCFHVLMLAFVRNAGKVLLSFVSWCSHLRCRLKLFNCTSEDIDQLTWPQWSSLTLLIEILTGTHLGSRKLYEST